MGLDTAKTKKSSRRKLQRKGKLELLFDRDGDGFNQIFRLPFLQLIQK